jgi:hypothetical protein
MDKAFKYFSLVSLMALSCFACSNKHNEYLEQNWKMKNADVYYQFKPDSTFTAREKQNTYEGKWSIAGDNRTLKMIADNGVVKIVTIKALDKDSMVLVDSYEDIVFKPVK